MKSPPEPTADGFPAPAANGNFQTQQPVADRNLPSQSNAHDIYASLSVSHFSKANSITDQDNSSPTSQLHNIPALALDASLNQGLEAGVCSESTLTAGPGAHSAPTASSSAGLAEPRAAIQAQSSLSGNSASATTSALPVCVALASDAQTTDTIVQKSSDFAAQTEPSNVSPSVSVSAVDPVQSSATSGHLQNELKSSELTGLNHLPTTDQSNTLYVVGANNSNLQREHPAVGVHSSAVVAILASEVDLNDSTIPVFSSRPAPSLDRSPLVSLINVSPLQEDSPAWSEAVFVFIWFTVAHRMLFHLSRVQSLFCFDVIRHCYSNCKALLLTLEAWQPFHHVRLCV